MRIDNLNELPAAMREKLGRALAREARLAFQKTQAPEALPPSKYKNKKTEVDGICFDSKKEAQRFVTLRLLAQAGEITELRLQAEFTLQEAYTTPDGERVRAIRYRADFCYRDRAGTLVVEDVKSAGTRTREYIMKKKLLLNRFGIAVTEV